jgi:cellulose synthase/poly-beta-1,6-N-acetylglucosamine synthase-like glycosyltransferase
MLSIWLNVATGLTAAFSPEVCYSRRTPDDNPDFWWTRLAPP